MLEQKYYHVVDLIYPNVRGFFDLMMEFRKSSNMAKLYVMYVLLSIK